MPKKSKKKKISHWKKHKPIVISGVQILAALTIIAGVANNYINSKKNAADIKQTNDWVGNNLSNKTSLIIDLQKQLTDLSE